MSNRRSMAREIGTAFAVLAIYLLTILSPLHQARASQLAFQELGYATTQTGWVLCTPLEQNREDRLAVSKCPATGIGKHDAALPEPATIPLPVERPAALSLRLGQDRPLKSFNPANTLGPRGPPVTV